MSYPKWVTRDVPYDTNYLTNHDACAFAIHEDYLYYLTGDDGLFRVDSWCETGGALRVSVTQLSALTNGHGYPEGDIMLSALGVLWFTRLGNLYNYDAGAINGPWTVPMGRMFDLAEYGGNIYTITTWGSPWVLGLWCFDIASETWSQIYTTTPSHGLVGGSLATFQGILYFSNLFNLFSYNGAAVALVHTFGGADPIGIVRANNDTVLHVGTGSWSVYTASGPPNLWGWDGAAMNFIVNITTAFTAKPYALTYRSDEELYAFCAWTGHFLGWWYNTEYIYKINPVAGTSVLDDYTPACAPTYSYTNDFRSLCYWPQQDSVWAGEQRTKVFAANMCTAPRTYFFLA